MTTFYRILALLLLCGSLLVPASRAQTLPSNPPSLGVEKLALQVGGTAQVRATYAHDDLAASNRVGFGVRRLRLRLKASWGERVAFFIQGEGANAEFRVLDLALEYRLSSALQLRAGRILGARPAALASHTKIDAIDRPVSVGEWAKRTVGADAHDFGIEARWTQPQGHIRAFLHNGDGHWGRARGNFREEVGVGSTTRGIDQTGLAATIEAAYRPQAVAGLEIGGFAGRNTTRNPNTAHNDMGRAYTTYGAHLYWGATPGSQPLRLKVDFLGLDYETPAAQGNFQQQVQGLSVFAASRLFRGSEVFARYEHFDPNTTHGGDDHTFLTLGASISPSAWRGLPYHQERITLAWTTRLDPVAPSYGLVLQAQFVF